MQSLVEGGGRGWMLQRGAGTARAVQIYSLSLQGLQIKGARSVCGGHRKATEAVVLWNAAEGDASPAPTRDHTQNLPPLMSG